MHKKPLVVMDERDVADGEINYREGSSAIPLDILEQKLLLHKGLVMVT